MLVTFIVGFTVAVGLGAVVVALVAPGSQPLCRPYTPCGPPAASAPLVNQTVWRSAEFGFRLEFPGSALAVSRQASAGLTLDLGTGSGTIIVRGRPAGQASPAQAITTDLKSLSGISQLEADTSPADRLLGPGVGYRTGAGGVYTGYQNASQGVGGEQKVYAEAATDGRVTISVIAIAPFSAAGPRSDIAQVADLIVNSIRWT